MSPEQLAQHVNYSASMIGAVERAERKPRLDFAKRCDDALGTDGLFTRLWELVQREAVPGWMQPLIDVEEEATELRGFELTVVHGWFQTPDYARAVLHAGQPGESEERIEELVTSRMKRQEIVLSRSDPPKIFAILDEGVLHRQWGSPKIMADQLEHLIGLAQNPRISLQVVTGEHAGAANFILATLADAHAVAYLDNVVEGQTTDSPEIVAKVTRLWEALRDDAIPKRASLEQIVKVAEQWT